LLAARSAVQRDPPDATAATEAPTTEAPAVAAPNHAPELIQATVDAADGRSLLLADDIRTALEGRGADADLAARFDGILREIDATSAEDGPLAALNIGAGDLVMLLERRFILDRGSSTLDLLGERRSRRYRRFAWGENDFPGGAGGANEARASEMIRALNDIRPERRANSTDDAVIGRREVDRDMETTIRSQFVNVEGQGSHRLHRDAAASFARMHAAAAAEGVDLRILDADRRFEASRRRAAEAGNNRAVADFSSHNLGLAIDFRLSVRGQRFREVRTRPFQNVVDMHAAPAHKWLFLRGEAFGWYAFHHEPWHWEYNPPGFRETFRASVGMAAEDDPAGAVGGAPTPVPEGAEPEAAPAE
jgi:hypothetical protein